MKSTALMLVLSLALPGMAADHYAETKKPETKKAYAKEETKKAKPAAKPATAHAPAPAANGSETRLKALEAENLKLRQELANKNGANAAVAGSEAASPEGALAELQAGNARFVMGARTRSQMGFNDAALRQTLAKGQAPFAVVITCSDSRLGDNYIFDQELGRLFTIREAGNSPDIQGLASVEYAVEHLGSKVVVVMGHDSCGAVKAVKEAGSTLLPGNLWSLQAAMSGLLESVHTKPGESEAQHMAHLVETNAVRQAGIVVSRSAIVAHLVSSGKLKVVPAVYELASGKVTFLPPVGAGAAPAEHEAHH
jgi:carbonic anhydrase